MQHFAQCSSFQIEYLFHKFLFIIILKIFHECVLLDHSIYIKDCMCVCVHVMSAYDGIMYVYVLHVCHNFTFSKKFRSVDMKLYGFSFSTIYFKWRS